MHVLGYPNLSSDQIAKNLPVTALMSPQKPKVKGLPASTPPTDLATKTLYLARDGLGAYLADPSSFPSSRVIYHNEEFVVINDLFPKSSIHLLLLPRNREKMLLHPFEAFEDVEYLMSVRAEVERLRVLAAKELKRKFGRSSEKEIARETALARMETRADGGDAAQLEEEAGQADGVSEGRDWNKEIISGIHMGPSMNHLHVHVLSREMHSECMRHRKHFNSFQTPFLVPVEDFPLSEGDERRRHHAAGALLESDLVCWRCGLSFGNKFKRLKEHLEQEFEAWKRE